MSVKGQVVIPKDVRDQMGWREGTKLEAVNTPQGVLLRDIPIQRKALSVDEALARIHARIKYDGSPISIEEMNESISDMFKNAESERH